MFNNSINSKKHFFSKNNLINEHKSITENKLNPNKDINIEEFMKTDPDDMDYDNAVKRDKRKFCTYFCEKIKKDLIILNIFFNKEILNPWP